MESGTVLAWELPSEDIGRDASPIEMLCQRTPAEVSAFAFAIPLASRGWHILAPMIQDLGNMPDVPSSLAGTKQKIVFVGTV